MLYMMDDGEQKELMTAFVNGAMDDLSLMIDHIVKHAECCKSFKNQAHINNYLGDGPQAKETPTAIIKHAAPQAIAGFQDKTFNLYDDTKTKCVGGKRGIIEVDPEVMGDEGNKLEKEQEKARQKAMATAEGREG